MASILCLSRISHSTLNSSSALHLIASPVSHMTVRNAHPHSLSSCAIPPSTTTAQLSTLLYFADTDMFFDENSPHTAPPLLTFKWCGLQISTHPHTLPLSLELPLHPPTSSALPTMSSLTPTSSGDDSSTIPLTTVFSSTIIGVTSTSVIVLPLPTSDSASSSSSVGHWVVDEDSDWLFLITSSYTLCVTKTSKVMCWDIQTDACLTKLNLELDGSCGSAESNSRRGLFFTMVKVLIKSCAFSLNFFIFALLTSLKVTTTIAWLDRD